MISYLRPARNVMTSCSPEWRSARGNCMLQLRLNLHHKLANERRVDCESVYCFAHLSLRAVHGAPQDSLCGLVLHRQTEICSAGLIAICPPVFCNSFGRKEPIIAAVGRQGGSASMALVVENPVPVLSREMRARELRSRMSSAEQAGFAFLASDAGPCCRA